ncbi:alanine/glycine:cation symporter family protein [Eubacterium sp. 1001713B170207_170306_E7]|uniref:alanine/glycine:cation symporter family protein n=1 Tax=Eubacterium sp. 1001713B170207_170306_E7 TaxID=2787097 RepID=UPI001899CC4D|nr:alanine/glycine:cation symporter family protein [Eubacterium sp. 1001713B170207_170306_E7]
MEAFMTITEAVKNLVWSNVLVALLMGAGIYFSIRLKFPQLRFFKEMFRVLKSKGGTDDGITPFQAFATALGARVGVGNIAGVATAIFFGGPGALFWIWAFGFFATCTALAEATLGQAYKIKAGNEYLGGPAFYIERGLRCKPLAQIFAVILILGIGILMPGIQMNAIVSTLENAYAVNTLVTAVIGTGLIGIVIWGGIKRIGRVAEGLAPFMCAIYLLFGIAVIIQNITKVPDVLGMIFSSAFGINAIFGGILGSAVSWGVRRGIFSTDAGYGSGGIMAAAAEATHPAKQGLIQALSIYLSIFIVCTISGFVILLSGIYNVMNERTGAMLVNNAQNIEQGALWVQTALNNLTPDTLLWEGKILSVIIALFALTTLLGYYYQIESNVRYLFRNVGTLGRAVLRVAFLAAIFIGGIADSSMLWNVMDIGVACMAWINIVVILLLSKQVAKIMKDYELQKRNGIEEPVFDPALLKLEDTTSVWSKYQKKK